jgi:HAD superfamily hydrolase (TIGR01459 family)
LRVQCVRTKATRADVTQIIDRLAEISDRYDALFCDLWGCLHDGLRPFPEAVAALRQYRASGGKVVLVTNAPRPRAAIQRQLERIGVPCDCWDTIATSGDSARLALYQGAIGRRVWHMGPSHDAPFFEPLHMLDNPIEIERVPLAEAEGVACTGPFDPHADPETWRPDLLLARERSLKLLCANPDIVVDRGDTREWCAGAIAEMYTQMGGTSLYFGKPHPPIYYLARQRLAELGADHDATVLAVGDGIATDVAGAIGEDLDVVYVTGGLDAAATGTSHGPDPLALRNHLLSKGYSPTFAIGRLR